MRAREIINELISPLQFKLRNAKWNYPHDVIEWLTSKNFRELGNGVYSSAYTYPGSTTVIKVSYQEDKCWLRFAEWVMKNRSQKNRHLPRIDWIRRYNTVSPNGTQRTFFIAMMERLDPAHTDSIKSELITHTKDLGALVVLLLNYDCFYTDDHVLPRLIKEGIIDKSDSLDEKFRKLDAFAKTDKGAIRFAKIAERAVGSTGCMEDLHSENIMYRKSDRSIVITDPSAGMAY